jgi:hypothetical protein
MLPIIFSKLLLMRNIHIIILLLIIILIAILYNNKNKSESFYDTKLDAKIKCVANYDTPIGTKVCCGQPGNIENTKYVCPKEKPICKDYIYNVQWGQCKTLAQCNDEKIKKNIVKHKKSPIPETKKHSDPSPIGTTIERGGRWSIPQQKNAGYKAYCRCISKDNTKGISVCNTGCGNPNQICNTNFGCTPSNRGCNKDRCTCKPENISGNTMTYKECSEQCNRINMKIPENSQQVSIAKSTGCDIEGREMWVQNKNSEGNEKSCKFKISGNCRTYPNMSNHNWFNDDQYGGPIPSTKESCEKRKSYWENSCNLPSASINMEYNGNNENTKGHEHKHHHKHGNNNDSDRHRHSDRHKHGNRHRHSDRHKHGNRHRHSDRHKHGNRHRHRHRA